MENSNESLYEKSMRFNCEGIRCLENSYKDYNLQKLKDTINCGAFSTREIRNVDHERPMMFDEYRFQHFNYCSIHTIDGYSVCKDCKNCGFNKNIKIKK
mgnify:CR=1 FL=1|tara:strand:+ start:45 stop:341 length:297 start_codon:yes stop_codon:yes gene_type:complete